jgi:hypothetical protein
MAIPKQHYLTEEPRVSLRQGQDGPYFSLFYDYDQKRDNKLTGMNNEQKALWFKARIEMIFLSPLREVFAIPPPPAFHHLMAKSASSPRSFSIALMAMMLSGVEALGSFLRPDLCRPRSIRDYNKEMFKAFLEKYMCQWSNQPLQNGNPPINEFLWIHFRNGIAHGFQISGCGSLEFLKDKPFNWTGEIVQVCPIHFFQDLDAGVKTYCSDLIQDPTIQREFLMRFDDVYPN